MSHFVRVKTRFTDREALVEALICMGVPRGIIESAEQPIGLLNYYGRPDGTAEIVVRKQALNQVGNGFRISSDLGYKRNRDGTYELVLDGMNTHSALGANWQELLGLEYAAQITIKTQQAAGRRVEVERQPCGRLQLQKDGSVHLAVSGFRS